MDSTDGNAAFDRGALAVLQREIQATRLFVWGQNAGGVLMSTEIPVMPIAQQVHGVGRLLDTNQTEAMKILQSASSAFESAVQRWNAQVRQSEERLRATRAVKGLQEAKARHNAIRTRIHPVQNLFQRAIHSISQPNPRHGDETSG